MPRQRQYNNNRPSPIRLTERDTQILEALYAFDGLLSLRQIDSLFFGGHGGTWPRERLRSLAAHGYLQIVTGADAAFVPRGETAYLLGKAGAAYLAGQRGMSLAQFAWRQTPRRSLIPHDLHVNDFRLDVQTAVTADPALVMDEWLPEGEFLACPDRVTYQDWRGQSRQRQVRPDGFFHLTQNVGGQLYRFAYLLEMDLGTEDNPRFARDKVLPGVPYLSSSAYQQRFGCEYGRWLVVTTSVKRLQNLMTYTSRYGGDGLYYFTTLAELNPQDVLHAPIWRVAGQSEYVTLLLPA